MGERCFELRRDRLVVRLGEAIAFAAFARERGDEVSGTSLDGVARAIASLLDLPRPASLEGPVISWLVGHARAEHPITEAIDALQDAELGALYRLSVLAAPFAVAPPEPRAELRPRMLELGATAGFGVEAWTEVVDALVAETGTQFHDDLDAHLEAFTLRAIPCADARLGAWRFGTTTALAGALRVTGSTDGPAAARALSKLKHLESKAIAEPLGVSAIRAFEPPPDDAVKGVFALREYVLGAFDGVDRELERRYGPDTAALRQLAGQLVLVTLTASPETARLTSDWIDLLLPALDAARVHPRAYCRLIAIPTGRPPIDHAEAEPNAAPRVAASDGGEASAKDARARVEETIAAIAAALEREHKGTERPTRSDPPARWRASFPVAQTVWRLGFDLAQAAVFAGLGDRPTSDVVLAECNGLLQVLGLPPAPRPFAAGPAEALLDAPAEALSVVQELGASELAVALLRLAPQHGAKLIQAFSLALEASGLGAEWPPWVTDRLHELSFGAPPAAIAFAAARNTRSLRDAYASYDAAPSAREARRAHAFALGVDVFVAALRRLEKKGGSREVADLDAEIEGCLAALDVAAPPEFVPDDDPKVAVVSFVVYTTLGAVAALARDVERAAGAELGALVSLGASLKVFEWVAPGMEGRDEAEDVETHTHSVVMHAVRARLPRWLWASAASLPDAPRSGGALSTEIRIIERAVRLFLSRS